MDRVGSSENDYLFAGEQFDEGLGQYYLRQRYYDASMGRFTRRDTYEGSLDEPVTLNKYLYANGNPVSYTDPSGLFSLGEISAANSIANILNEIQFDSGMRFLATATSGDEPNPLSVLKDSLLTLSLIAVAPLFAAAISASANKIGKVADEYRIWAKQVKLRTWQEAGISSSNAKRIQNAANRTGITVVVVGSRARGNPRFDSDWDYVLMGGNSRKRHSIKSSLPRGTGGGEEIATIGRTTTGRDFFYGDPYGDIVLFEPE